MKELKKAAKELNEFMKFEEGIDVSKKATEKQLTKDLKEATGEIEIEEFPKLTPETQKVLAEIDGVLDDGKTNAGSLYEPKEVKKDEEVEKPKKEKVKVEKNKTEKPKRKKKVPVEKVNTVEEDFIDTKETDKIIAELQNKIANLEGKLASRGTPSNEFGHKVGSVGATVDEILTRKKGITLEEIEKKVHEKFPVEDVGTEFGLEKEEAKEKIVKSIKRHINRLRKEKLLIEKTTYRIEKSE